MFNKLRSCPLPYAGLCEKDVVWMGTGKPGRMISIKKKKKYYYCVSFQFLGPRNELQSLHKSPNAAFIASWKEFLVMALALLNMHSEKQQHPYSCHVFI